jgi:hypothetical protein
MPDLSICNIEPFLYPVTPQPGETGVSGENIAQTSIEGYLNRLREAICADLQAINDECCGSTPVDPVDPGGGAETFLELSDTPGSYAGAGGDTVKVKAGEDGLEFVTVSGGGADDDGLSLDFSTSEQATNRTWIGGETIYQKTINFGPLPNTSAKAVNHGITGLGRIIRVNAVAWDSAANQHLVLPFATTTGVTTFQIQMNVNSSQITITTGNNRTAYSAYVTLWYLKV